MKKELKNKVKSNTMSALYNRITKNIRFGTMILIGLVFFTLDLGATHIVGGNITYKKIGPNRFEVTLELRRDCNLGSPEAQFDDPAAIGIFSTLGALQVGLGTNGMILIPYDDSDTLNNVIESDCGFEGAQVCVEEFKYVQEFTLPRRTGGYILTYQRCCRNASLNNVVDPLNTGASYTVRIPESAFDSDNDSPLFNQWPPVYICANEPINFDHSAMDTDGDSLVYSLCVPKNGASFDRPMPQPPGPPPYDDIVWQTPYDINNLLGGTPLSIDSKTGLITGNPNTVGQFLVGVCVEEYRNGLLIGRVNRDFQYNVRVCSDPPSANFDAPTSKCDGLEIDFTNTSTSATKFFWDFDYPNGVNTSIEENPTFTFPISGTYDVFLKIVRGTDQCNDSIVKTINVFDADFNVDFDANLDACQSDGSVTYTFTDQSTIDVVGVVSEAWNWTIVQNGVTQNFTGNPLTVDLASGDFTISLEVTASNGCIGDLTKDLKYADFELQPDFEVLIGGCSDDETINIVLNDLTEDNNPDYTISTLNWTVNAGGSVFLANGDNAIVTIPRTDFTVTLLATADNGCDSLISKDFKITNFIPSVDFTFSLDGCNGANNPLIKLVELSNDSVTYSSVLSYNWNLNGNVLVGDSVIYESVNEDTILAELSIEFDNGCFVSTTKTIIIDEIRPQVNYTWKADSCPTDEMVTIELTFDSSKVYGYDYDQLVWLAGIQSNPVNLTGNPVLITVPKDSSVVVTLSTTFENGCADVISNSFYPGDFATINLVGDTLILCPNEEAEITVGANPGFFYNWSPQAGLDLTDPENPIVSVGMDTWYYVTVSDGVCSVNDSIFIDILEQIDLTITGQDFTCLGDVNLTVTGGVGPGFYEWSTAVDFVTIIATGETLMTSFNGKSQTFYARFVGEVCTANPAGFTVTNETPELDFVDPFEICVFDTVQYRILNNTPDHILDITWDDDPHIIDGQTSLEPTIAAFPTDNDSFQLYFTVTNQFNCSLRDTLTILIGENPVVDFTYSVEDCGDFEVCFEIVGEFNGFPVWDLGDTTTNDDRFLVEQVCYNYPGAGTYEVTLSNVSAICPFATVIKTIVLNDSIPLFDVESIEVCINSDVKIPLPEGAAGLEFSWCDINGNEISKLDTLAVFVDKNVSYIVKVLDENGCPFSDTINVTVFDFNYNLTLPDVFCAGEEVETSIDVEGDLEYIYEWLPVDCIVSGGNTSNPTIVVNGTKTISVKVTHPTLGCVVEDQFTVTPTDLTIDVDADPDAEIYLGDSVEIFVVDQVEGDTYVWSTGETAGTIVVSPEMTTTYTVTVTDEDGCTGVASLTITVILPNCEEDVFLPNAFTPNGDDINSILYVRSNFVEDMLLIIYNRWNEEVFRSTSIKTGWDGTFKGKALASDSYAYYLRATCVDGFTIERSGSINLIR